METKKSEAYNYVNLYNGEIVQTIYVENCISDKTRVESGNCYRTKEEITPEVLEETWQRCYGAYFQDDKQDGAQQ